MIGLKEETKAGRGESLKTLYMQKYDKIILHKHGFPSSLPVHLLESHPDGPAPWTGLEDRPYVQQTDAQTCCYYITAGLCVCLFLSQRGCCPHLHRHV